MFKGNITKKTIGCIEHWKSFLYKDILLHGSNKLVKIKKRRKKWRNRKKKESVKEKEGETECMRKKNTGKFSTGQNYKSRFS